jgi:hypothetical protein
MAVSRYAKPVPAQVKKLASQVVDIPPPIKGLSLRDQTTVGKDPMKAPILDNWVIEEDKITCRPGIKFIHNRGSAAIWHLVPYYGPGQTLAAASNHELWDAQNGTVLKSGFTSDDWYWTAFSNLGQHDFTVLVNGADGVWSWSGGYVPAGTTVNVVSVSDATQAVVTVAAADIDKFHDGMIVTFAGATGTGWVNLNGAHSVSSVGTPANTFKVITVDTSTATGASPAGITAVPQGSMVKETVTAPSGATWINVDQFQIVTSHMNRLWFADNSNLALFYLPIQQKSGEVKVLPLNALFRRGGSIRAVYTWTIDGGAGLDDQLVVFTTNGECAIFNGTDPDTPDAWGLTGVFRFDSPMSKHSVANYGGDLYVLISTGLVPMTTMIRSETEQLGQYDKDVSTLFSKISDYHRFNFGWQVLLDHTTGRMICNLPLGADNSYQQMVRFMPNPIWASWSAIPSRCWNWISNQLFIGDDHGNVYQMAKGFLNDTFPDPIGRKPITVDVQTAWSAFKTPGIKHFRMVQAFFITEGRPLPKIDVRTDFDYSLPFNQPDITSAPDAATWDVSSWAITQEDPPNGAYWVGGVSAKHKWNGVAGVGHVGGIRVTARIDNCSFSIAGFDLVYEAGSVM